MTGVLDAPAASGAGLQMQELIGELYPICRSITGQGVRDSLRLLQKHIPLEIRSVPSGTQVLDWVVPREWNIRGAYVKDPAGRRIVDFADSNLHVVSYSAPVRRRMPLAELREHLFSLPEHPDWIPYRTSYYREDWGFSVTHRLLEGMEDGEYEVCIDSTLEPGQLNFGELRLQGRTDEEVLLSCHCCHPSLCNDNLSGMALCTFLAKELLGTETRYSYRFLFLPGTIGSITWLALNEARARNIKHGLVAACVGDAGGFRYKRSRQGNAEIDRAAAHVLKHRDTGHEIVDFSPYGYDERQYCSPGFNLAVGSLTRSGHGQYPEYHTSADNLGLVRPGALEESLSVYREILGVIEGNCRYRNTQPKGEPQLGRRGLYGSVGGWAALGLNEAAMLWVLNLSDGEWSLLDIAERAGLRFESVRAAAEALEQHSLLERI